jgi:pilus assembly protein Flp/PilA
MTSLFTFLTSTFSHLVGRGVQRLRDDERGLEAVEYALIAALIAVAIVAAVTLLGTTLDGVFTAITNELGPLAPAPAP